MDKSQGDAGSGDAPSSGQEQTPQHFNMSGVGRHAAVYAIGVFMERGIGFIMLPVYTTFLTTEDYGIMGLIVMTLEFITILAGAKLTRGIFRFYHKAETREGKDRVVSTSHMLLLATYFFTSLLCFFIAEPLSIQIFQSADNAWLIRIASWAMFAQSLPIVPLSYAQVRDESRLYVIASGIRLFLAVGLNVLFLWGLGWGVESMFISTILSQGLVGIYLNLHLVRQVGIKFDVPTMKVLFAYTAPIIGTQFASFIYVFGDRYVLQREWGEGAVGLYHVAYRFAVMLPMIAVGPISRVWGPKRFEIAKRPDRDKILSRGLLYQNLSMMTFFVGIAVFVDDVVALMTAPEFQGAARLVPLVMLAYVFHVLTEIQNLGILIKEKTKWLFVADWVAAGTAVVGYLTLIPPYGGLGAAGATVLAYMVRYLLIYNISQRLWRVEYEWAPTLKAVGVAVLTLAGAHFVYVEAQPWAFLVKTAWILFFFVAIWSINLFTEREKDWFRVFPGKVLRAVLRTVGWGRG